MPAASVRSVSISSWTHTTHGAVPPGTSSLWVLVTSMWFAFTGCHHLSLMYSTGHRYWLTKQDVPLTLSSYSCSRPLALNTCRLSDARKRTNALCREEGIINGGKVAPVRLLFFVLIIIHRLRESIFRGWVRGWMRLLAPKNWLVRLKKSARDQRSAYCN